MSSRARRAVLAALVPLAAACGDGSGGVVGVAAPASTEGALRATVVVPATATAGTLVPVFVRLHNTGLAALPLMLRAHGQQVVFAVDITGPDGAVVWQSLPSGQPVLGAFTRFTLAAGGTMELATSWDTRTAAGGLAPPGSYNVRARVLAQPADVVAAQAGILVR
jgi:hypothetical protein